MTDVDELLRRDGARWRDTATIPPRVDWTSIPSGRRVHRPSWWMVGVSAVAAAAIAALAILVPSLVNGNNGTATPVHQPGPHALGGPAHFMAISTDGSVGTVNARTGITLGMFSREAGSRATALAVTNDGNLGFATFSQPSCKVSVLRQRQTSATTADETQAATVAGVKAHAIAVSPDGHKLALAVEPCVGRSDVDDLVVVDLQTDLQSRWTGYSSDSLLTGLQWAPDNRTLAYNVKHCCGVMPEQPRLLDTGTYGTSYLTPTPLRGANMAFWYRGQLAAVVDSETTPNQADIRALSTNGILGGVLARGLPGDVVGVRPDRTGVHLLLTTKSGKLLRWDDGVVTPLQGHWTDAGW